MSIIEYALIAAALAMDAFAVSVGRGCAAKRAKAADALLLGATFGLFQMAMPLIGFFVGGRFARYISGIGHWVAAVLLAYIGFSMIRSARKPGSDAAPATRLTLRLLLTLAIATSVDALAAGVSFAALHIPNLFTPILLIGAFAFALSFLGYMAGSKLGAVFSDKAEFAGGALLIALGLKIVVERLGLFRR